MKLLAILLLICLGVCPIVCHKVRNILLNEFKDKTKSLENIEVWRNKLRDDFKQNLMKLPETVKKGIISKADDLLKTTWDPLLVTDFLEFKRNGNRNNYEGKNFNRRKRLEALIVAEILTENVKYLNEAANGLWLLMEESTWTWPAHLGMQKAGAGLPDPNQFVIDLGAGESSAYVAWIRLLLGDKLTKINPMFVKRIDYELERRILQRYLHDDFKNWMGLEGQAVNNWNIWINTNVLMTTLLTVSNKTENTELLNRIVKSADDWLNWYGDDGGCDEGPSYWYQAGGRFIQFLYFMSSASNNQMDWSKNTLIDSIGSYIYKMHIDKNYFVNFADASPKQTPDPTLVYRYGELFKNPKMKEFAAFCYQMAGKESYLLSDDFSGNLHLFYLQMSAYHSLTNTTPKAPQPIESWFPDLQVITLRTEEGSAKGLFLGAKAGTNGESHNHNDVGSFVLYVNGLPALIDVGVGTYTAKTFGAHRYEIWSMQSQWHNTPTINGFQQHDGGSYRAKNVSFTKVSNDAVFEADISGAYPKEANVDSWVRKLTFNRSSKSLELSESFKLSKFVEPFKVHFITILNVTVDQNKGQVVLSDKNTKLNMSFNKDILDVKVDEHKTEDSKLQHEWGDVVHRVTLIGKSKELIGKHLINFHI